VWLNAPFNDLCSFVSHYKDCKNKTPGSTSALIVVPVMPKHPVNQLLLTGMQKAGLSSIHWALSCLQE
jgi:hypothetical protein